MATRTLTIEHLELMSKWRNTGDFFYHHLDQGDRIELWGVKSLTAVSYDDRQHLNRIREKWIKYLKQKKYNG